MKNTLLLMLLVGLGLAAGPAAGQAVRTPTAQVLAGPTGQVLSVSDIHFGVSNLQALLPLLYKQDVSQWDQLLQAYETEGQPPFMSPCGNSEDTNYWLLESALQHMQARCPQPDYIVITGDMLAHNFTYDSVAVGSQQYVVMGKVYDYLAAKFQKYFPNTVVLPGLGNNDTDKKDDNPPSPAYRQRFAQAWAPCLYATAAGRQQFVQDFGARGYYRYVLPATPGIPAAPAAAGAPGRRVLMLNSVLFLNNHSPLPTQLPQATAELSWLQQELQAASAVAAPTWLAMHVPPGTNVFNSVGKASSCAQGAAGIVPMWIPDCTTSFQAKVAAYPGVVRAGLAGHTHMDEFRLLTGPQGRFLTYFHVTPAVSPLFQNNAAFQVLSYDPASLAIRDVRTHYQNLTVFAPSGFQAEYSFRDTYPVPAGAVLDTASLRQVWQALGRYKKAPQRAYASYFTSLAPPPAGSPTPTDSTSWRYYWCAAGTTTSAEYCQCLARWQQQYGTPAPPVAAVRAPVPATSPGRPARSKKR